MSSERPRHGLMLVVSSPSGAGKTSLSRRLVADHGDLVLSVSATTRAPRPGEEDGREYHFLDRDRFDAMVAEGVFLEWAEVHEHRYGTLRAQVAQALAAQNDILFDIDWQGAARIAAAAPDEVVRVFILPPTMQDLGRRLHARAQDAEDVIQRRVGRAYGEIQRWGDYDYIIVNDNFDRAYEDHLHIYGAERLRRLRNPWLSPFVTELLAE